VILDTARNGDGPVWKYRLPKFMSFDTGRIDAMRRAAIVRRDEWLAMQKEFGAARDADGARFCKGEATDALKEYRAACLMLGFLVVDPPGDSPYRPEWEWPVELAPWIDRVVRECEA
jgi:hypothetical protein